MGKSSSSSSMVLSYLTSISHHNLYVFPSKARILLCAKEAIIRFPVIVLFTAKSLQVKFVKFKGYNKTQIEFWSGNLALPAILAWTSAPPATPCSPQPLHQYLPRVGSE